MDPRMHWEEIYATKAADQVSWYRPHLETSLALIDRCASDRSASIIDVGGGESTLVDDLLAYGFQNITVLDVSQTAIEATKRRLAQIAKHDATVPLLPLQNGLKLDYCSSAGSGTLAEETEE